MILLLSYTYKCMYYVEIAKRDCHNILITTHGIIAKYLYFGYQPVSNNKFDE